MFTVISQVSQVTPPRTSSVFHGTPGTPPRTSSVFHGTPGTPEGASIPPSLPDLVQGKDLMSRTEKAAKRKGDPGMIRRSLELALDTGAGTTALSSSSVMPVPEYNGPLPCQEDNLSDKEATAKKPRVES